MRLPGMRPLAVRDTLQINGLGLLTIPVLAFISPRVEVNDDERVRVRIPLNYRTRNHLGSMYFGVLCCGCDLAAGLTTLRVMRERGVNLAPAFKDLQAEFLRRAEGDVLFESVQVREVHEAAAHCIATGERVNLPVRVTATVVGQDEPAARFTTTISMRHRPGGPRGLFERLVFRGA